MSLCFVDLKNLSQTDHFKTRRKKEEEKLEQKADVMTIMALIGENR